MQIGVRQGQVDAAMIDPKTTTNLRTNAIRSNGGRSVVAWVLRSKGRLLGITVLLCLLRASLRPTRRLRSILGNMIGDSELDGGPMSALGQKRTCAVH
jgi:hypothetical protein